MFYAMQVVEGCPTRVGRMTKRITVAIRAAERAPNGYVEQYGVGVVWTPKAPREIRVAAIRQH